MSKTKLISFLAIGLLLSNLVLAGYIMLNKPHQPPQEGPRNIIIERLHFNDAQVAEYDKLIQWHRNEIDEHQGQMANLKKQLYRTLSTQPSENKDSLIEAIATLQQEIERIHYKHFEDIKQLCTPKQQADFNALTEEIASLFAPHRPPHKPH